MSRLTEKEISLQLDQELLSFYNSRYEEEVPKDIIKLFKDALFHATPQSHQLHVSKLRSIFAKKESELTVGEVGGMVNVLMATPLDWLL